MNEKIHIFMLDMIIINYNYLMVFCEIDALYIINSNNDKFIICDSRLV